MPNVSSYTALEMFNNTDQNAPFLPNKKHSSLSRRDSLCHSLFASGSLNLALFSANCYFRKDGEWEYPGAQDLTLKMSG